MNRKKVSILIIIVIHMGLALWFFMEHNIEYTLLGSYVSEESYTTPRWRAVVPNGFYTIDMYKEDYVKDAGESLDTKFDLNAENSVYIVCYGSTLEKLTYREFQVSGRFASVHPDYYSVAYLRPCENNMQVNIYEVKNLRVEKDSHTGSSSAVILR